MKESITFKELQCYILNCLKSIGSLTAVNADPETIQAVYKKLEAAVIIADDLFQAGGKDGGKESA